MSGQGSSRVKRQTVSPTSKSGPLKATRSFSFVQVGSPLLTMKRNTPSCSPVNSSPSDNQVQRTKSYSYQSSETRASPERKSHSPQLCKGIVGIH